MMTLLLALATTVAVAAPTEKTAIVVEGQQPPVRITHASVLTASQGPPIVLYDAVNQTDKEYEQFTVTAFVFDILALDGEDLRERTLRERKRVLRRLLGLGSGALRPMVPLRGPAPPPCPGSCCALLARHEPACGRRRKTLDNSPKAV